PVDPATFTSTVSALSAVTATTAAAGSPISLRDAQGWAGSASNDPKKPFAVSVTDSEIAITATNQLGSKPVTYGAVGWDPLAPVEAIVPTELADDLDATDGSDLTAFIGGTPVSFRMVGDIAAVPGAATADDLDALEAGLPTSSRGETTIAVDGQALVHHLVQASATGQLADEFWLAPGAPPPVVTDGSGTVIAPSTVGQRMLEAPLRASVPALVALAVSASLLLALAGFGARTAAVTRSRRLEAAQLRAIGLSARGMVAVATIDTVAIALAGIIIGVASGVVTLWAVGTRIASGGQAAAGALVLPWQAFTILPVALLAALAVISLGVAAGQRRLPLSGLLRTGSDG
ncbi:MAG: hypothetical protein JWQ43_3094, partial [Glaciihabitans sp.]|nr:hypothetical protein [Glaciihabitans sp.]